MRRSRSTAAGCAGEEEENGDACRRTRSLPLDGGESARRWTPRHRVVDACMHPPVDDFNPKPGQLAAVLAVF